MTMSKTDIFEKPLSWLTDVLGINQNIITTSLFLVIVYWFSKKNVHILLGWDNLVNADYKKKIVFA